MKIKTRKKIDPIHLQPEDVLILKYTRVGKYIDGTERVLRSEEVLKSKIGRTLTVDEAVIFDVEEGDFKGAKDGIGGAFLSHK